MTKNKPERVRDIIQSAGGEIVGKTRLQKTVFILERAGYERNFSFTYHYYGPFSEDLSIAITDAIALGLIEEKVAQASWGGHYSIFSTDDNHQQSLPGKPLIDICASANPVALELAATAIFLADENHDDPWAEVVKRKPEKSNEAFLGQAKSLCAQLASLNTPNKIPSIA